MKILNLFQLVLPLSLLFTGCVVFKDAVKEDIAGTDDSRQYHWEVQAVLRPSEIQAISWTGLPLQISGQPDIPTVITEEYEDYTVRQMTELKIRLVNSGRYLTVRCRKLPVAPEK